MRQSLVPGLDEFTLDRDIPFALLASDIYELSTTRDGASGSTAFARASGIDLGGGDAVVVNSNGPPTVLRNDSPTENHWLKLKLVQPGGGNLNAIGARVWVTARGKTQMREVMSGRGYQSHYGMRLHFGLGKREQVDRIEVRWIGGPAVVLENVEADRLQTIRQER